MSTVAPQATALSLKLGSNSPSDLAANSQSYTTFNDTVDAQGNTYGNPAGTQC